MADNDLLESMLTQVQTEVAALRVAVARLEMRCSWFAGLLGLLGGAIPAAVLLIVRFIK